MTHRRICARVILSALAVSCLAAAPLKNDRYALDVQADFSVKVSAKGTPARTLSPTFIVMRSDKDPGLAANHRNYYLAPRTSARWNRYEVPLEELNQWLQTSDTLASTAPFKASVTEDAKGLRTWIYTDASGKQAYKLADKTFSGGTTDVFRAGTPIRPKATAANVSGNKVRWTFANAAPIALTAELELPPGDADPIIRWRASVASDGFYSVIFAGAPNEAASDVQTIPQEVFGRNYRQYNHVVHEGDLKLPRAQLALDAFSSTLVVDPSESRWGLPNRYNQRFGLMVERRDSRMRPMAIAPLLGGPESKLKAGQSLAFSVRYVLRAGEWRETLWHVARAIYGFKDQRDNSGTGSLNGTLERCMDYLADRNGKNWAMWNAEQRYYDYFADKSGVFKPFSPIFGLTAAVVTDDVDFYKRRALPTIEFALSRKSNIFSPFELKNNGMISNPTRDLGSPYPSAEQLVTIHDLFGRRTPIFATYAAEKGFEKGGFPARLAKWRLTGDAKDLAEAVRVADQQAKNPKGSYMDWLEMYEASPKPAYLTAAIADAYRQASNMNLSPPVPDTAVIMEKGGLTPVHAHSWGRHKVWGFAPPVEFPFKPQTVPAWRPALTGIISDAYRAGFWMNDQGQFMRLASYANDDYLRDLARWGMVGRFANHNGDNRSFLSCITESPDALENPIWKLSFTTVNPGHAWEFAGEIIDFLVSDAQHRSAGAIRFPGGSMNGSAFQCTSFGGRPGTFYGERDVTLWLPRKLLAIDNGQIDYLAGVGNGKLYVALWNQSFKDESVTVKVNDELATMSGIRTAKVWHGNKAAPDATIRDGTFTFTIPAKGIVAYAIAEAGAKTKLIAARESNSAPKLGPSSVSRAKAAFGNVNGMLISMGEGLTSAYIYTDAPPEVAINATLRYRQGADEWQTLHDEIFPWEFSLDVDPKKGPLEYVFEVETLDLEVQKAEPATLKAE